MDTKEISIVLGFVLTAVTIAIFGFNLGAALPFLPLALFLASLPYLISRYLRYVEIKAMEESFPEFLRNLAEAQRSGIPLPQAIINASKIDYGPLSKEIKKMAAQITWGIPFPKVLKLFSQRVRESNFLRRSIAVILEAYRSGGDIAEVMSSVAESARIVKELEAERKSRFNQQLMIMYAIYIIFLVIIVALNRILTPMFMLSASQEIGGISIGGGNLDPNFYRTIFLHMILMQGVFAGLLAGQVGEGSVIAGVKHSLVMLALGSLVFALFIPQNQLIVTLNLPYEVFPAGSAMELSGTVVNAQKIPVSDAEVKINLAGRIYITKTDPLGSFSQKVILPERKGRYRVVVEVKSKSGRGKASGEVVVG